MKKQLSHNHKQRNGRKREIANRGSSIGNKLGQACKSADEYQSKNDVERLSYDFYDKLDKQDDEVMRKGGMEVLTLAPAAGKKYVSMANQVVWDRLFKNSPADGPKLKALIE